MFSTVEKRAKISVKDHLGKGALTPLQTYTDSDKKYYGELHPNGRLHGRGINIYDNGIIIGYFENGGLSTGNYIYICWNGEFRVGERYTKDGND